MSAARRERSHSTGPSNGPRLSRLPIRDPGQASRQKSFDRKRTKSTLCEPSRFSRQRSGSLLRTPLAQTGARSVGKSPSLSSVKKDSRPITDKRWQYDQVVKVRNFIAQNEPQIDHNAIKAGMPSEMFIVLASVFFGRIDKRITINRENYIEEVPSRLRLLRYPTSVKASLMKAVNIPHSWPSVIAILGWLRDVVVECSTEVERIGNALHDAASKCLTDRYYLWNLFTEEATGELESELQKPMQDLKIAAADYFGNDPEKLRQLEERCRTLQASVNDYAEVNKRKRTENMALKEESASLHTKCEAFLLTNKAFEEKIALLKANVSKKSEKLDIELEELIAMENSLKDVVSKQKYSVADQERLASEIQELKNVILLQEERCLQQKSCVNEFDRKLSDLNHKIQTSAFCYNNVMRNMKILDPSFKELEIIESGFMRTNTPQTFDEIFKKLSEKAEEMRAKLNGQKNGLADINQTTQTLEKQLEAVTNELEECMRIEVEEEYTAEQQLARIEREKQLTANTLSGLQSELLDLKGKRPDIEALPPKIVEIQKRCDLIDEKTRELKRKAVKFFMKLDLAISNNLLDYLKIMDNLNKNYAENTETLGLAVESYTEFLEKLNQDINDGQSQKKN